MTIRQHEQPLNWKTRMSRRHGWWLYLMIIPLVYLLYCVLHWTGIMPTIN